MSSAGNWVSTGTFYLWKKRYKGMEVQELKRLKELEEENRKLKQMYAELVLDNKILKDALGKKFRALLTGGNG
jgi:putative transposase